MKAEKQRQDTEQYGIETGAQLEFEYFKAA